MILDPATATPESIALVAAELPGGTMWTLIEAFPVGRPEGGYAYVPARRRGGSLRFTQALQRRGLVEPDPSGLWSGFVTVAGMLVRDHLLRQSRQENAELLAAYRGYVTRCACCSPHRVGLVTIRDVDTHVRKG